MILIMLSFGVLKKVKKPDFLDLGDSVGGNHLGLLNFQVYDLRKIDFTSKG